MIRVGGLIDAHVHLAAPESIAGVEPDWFVSRGIIGVVEAGSYGVDGFDRIAASWRSAIAVRAFVNVVPRGLRGTREMWGAPPSDDPATMFKESKVKPDGVKIRIGASPDRDDLADTRRAKIAARALGVPLMVHITNGRCDPDAFFDLMERRDIVTHCFCPPPFTVLDSEGKVRRSVREARDRGVVFDVARSSGVHWDANVAKAALAQGFEPDFISTDFAIPRPGGPQPWSVYQVMNEFLTLGMDRAAALLAATERPAHFYEFDLPTATSSSYVELSDDLKLERVVRNGKDLYAEGS